MNKITGALVFCLAALMGIPSLAAAQDKVPPNAELLVGAEPAVGKEAVGTVGSTIFAQFRYWHKKGLVADGMVSTWIALNPVIINKGDFLVKLTDKKGDIAFCEEQNGHYQDIYATPCLLDTNSDGQFDQLRYRPGWKVLSKPLDVPVKYSESEISIKSDSAFKYELIYLGTANSVMRLAYREYLGDFARPAFSQEVTYNVASLPTTISFRNIRIAVREIDNNGMKYQLIQY